VASQHLAWLQAVPSYISIGMGKDAAAAAPRSPDEAAMQLNRTSLMTWLDSALTCSAVTCTVPGEMRSGVKYSRGQGYTSY
jgi:hypothetical protein